MVKMKQDIFNVLFVKGITIHQKIARHYLINLINKLYLCDIKGQNHKKEKTLEEIISNQAVLDI